ncbi:hypothetical protein GGI12_006026, partial [Dipsacomyces acuminosporus]
RYLSPNFHLCLHLAKAVDDFGPVHGHSCFPFERLNGNAKRAPTSCRDIACEVLDTHLEKLVLVTDAMRNADSRTLLPELAMSLQYAVADPAFSGDELLQQRCLATRVIDRTTTGAERINARMLGKGKPTAMTTNMINELVNYYNTVYPGRRHTADKDGHGGMLALDHSMVVYDKAMMFDDVYNSSSSGNASSSMIVVRFIETTARKRKRDRRSRCPTEEEEVDYVGKVRFFFEHTLECLSGGEWDAKTHRLAYVDWLKLHARKDMFKVAGIEQQPPLAEVWSTQGYACNYQPIVPVTRISQRCAYTRLQLSDDEVVYTLFPVFPKISI